MDRPEDESLEELLEQVRSVKEGKSVKLYYWAHSWAGVKVPKSGPQTFTDWVDEKLGESK